LNALVGRPYFIADAAEQNLVVRCHGSLVLSAGYPPSR
jgi:hypothetical protein